MNPASRARPLHAATGSPTELGTALTSGEIPVAVYGLGKMGLPLAAVYAEVTGNVVGVDVDETVVDRVAAGECPVENEPGLATAVAESVDAGNLRTSANPASAAADASLHVIIVPTRLRDGGEPDLSNLLAAVRDVGRGLSPGDLLVVESTVPPGTCRDIVVPELCEESDLAPDRFGVAYCPERTSSGRALRDIRGAYPKVVGGVNDRSTRAAALVYGELIDNDVITVSDATTAEAVKVFEGVYRDVNIALANELAELSDDLGIDGTEAMATANTQPYCDIHDPGPGVGGHCIPYYPYFLTSQATADAPLIQTARTVNEQMPLYVVRKLKTLLADGDVALADASVLLLGVTYRAGVKETRESPALAIAGALSRRGAEVYAADPLVEDMSDVPATPIALEGTEDLDLDATVLVTPHNAFDGIDWTAFDPMVVIDGRNTLELAETDHDVYTIGRGR